VTTPAGAKRRYLLYLPSAYDGRRPVPLVLNLHGYGGTPELQQLYSGLGLVGEDEGFAVAALAGQGKPLHYNVRDTRSDGEESDVHVAGALVDHLAKTLCVDEDRVYAAGMSNGGALAVAAACYDSDRYAAVAAVAALVYDPSCDRGRPVPMIVFRGTGDPIVPYGGGRVRCCGGPVVNDTKADITSWAKHNGCSATPRITTKGTVVTTRYTGCTGGADVVLHTVIGGGHTWPGAIAVPGLGKNTGKDELDASVEIWKFFARHPGRRQP
jgi:polyhydroxybutyrate depolymerase